MKKENYLVFIPEMRVIVPDVYVVAKVFHHLMDAPVGNKELSAFNAKPKEILPGLFDPSDTFLPQASHMLTTEYGSQDYENKILNTIRNTNCGGLNFVAALVPSDLRRLRASCYLNEKTNRGFVLNIGTSVLEGKDGFTENPENSEKEETEIALELINFLRDNGCKVEKYELDPYHVCDDAK